MKNFITLLIKFNLLCLLTTISISILTNNNFANANTISCYDKPRSDKASLVIGLAGFETNKNYTISVQSSELLAQLGSCLGVDSDQYYHTQAYSPRYGVFIGETRKTSMGRGTNLARLVADHYYDTSSVVLKCDYSVGTGSSPQWFALYSLTLYNCVVH